MTIKRILFVEDNAQEQEWFDSAVASWNSKPESVNKQFSIVLRSNRAEAETALEEGRFDCALFDLRIPSGRPGRPTEPSGNELAHLAVKDYGIPVAIISGNMADLDPDLRRIGRVGLFDKGIGDPYVEAIEWFGCDWQMMSILDASRRQMRSSAAEVFWKRVWPRWSSFQQLRGVDDAELTAIVTRQYVSHVAESLGIDDPEKKVKWHPVEAYISPALQSERAHTGDIFEISGQLWVVLTPQCDMATKKAKNILIAPCEKMSEKSWKKKTGVLTNLPDNKDEKEEILEYFRNLVNQNLAVSQHFLPPLPDEAVPMMVSFKDVKTITKEEIEANLQHRKPAIAPPFLGNLTQRFGAYISRMGQPNIDFSYFKSSSA